MRKEIGSEFWNIPVSVENHYFSSSVQWFSSGRAALQRILEECKPRTAALPSWCCDSMIRPFLQAGAQVQFYPVYTEDGLVQDLRNVDADCVLVMDYFGYTGKVNLSGYCGTVIRDVTHSVFSNTYEDAHYYFGSLRKWAGFWTGGFGWGMKPRMLPADTGYSDMRQSAMEEKAQYIAGLSNSKDYLEHFAKAEDYLDEMLPAQAAARDIACAGTLDIAGLKQRRRDNAAQLLEAFSSIALFPHLGVQDCPLFVPILVPDGKRDALRRYLIGHEIYCPVHWPVSEYHQLTEQTRYLYENELSLVCDQRYTKEDMLRLIGYINQFWKECL